MNIRFIANFFGNCFVFLCKNVILCRKLMFVTLVGRNSLLCNKLVSENNFIFVCSFVKCYFLKMQLN